MLTCMTVFRVFSLFSCSYGRDWPDVYDYDLAQFLTIAKEVQKQQKLLFESLLLGLHLQGKCEDLDLYNSLKEKIPFRKNFNIRLGITIKYLLQLPEREISLEKINLRFLGFENLELDIKRGKGLWDQLFAIITMSEHYS